MPKPYAFRSEIELVGALGSDKTKLKAAEFFKQRFETAGEIVRLAVNGNTFRAFRKLPDKPSKVFREWTTNHVQETLRNIKDCSNQEDYAAYVHESTIALCAHWHEKMRDDIGYGRGAKLFNLVLKQLACLTELTDAERNQLIDLQHVPLDSYTIGGLRLVAPDLNIPRGATMNHVASEERYALFQERIRQIARKVGVPPIYYEILAYDSSH